MEPLYQMHEKPELESPVMLVVLEGWIDAGLGAASAGQAIAAESALQTIATFDTDRLLDWRARRPVMHLREGVNTGLSWPSLELRAGRDRDGNDLLMLTGQEPDAYWRSFSDQVIALVHDLGVRLMVGFGAYPFATPHTRASRVSITANSPELASSLPLVKNTVDVPAGVEAVLERRAFETQLSAVGLWAQVPHYAAAMAYPAAGVALCDALQSIAGVRFDVASLREAAATHRSRLDELVGQNEEHLGMLRQLEAAYDAEEEQLRDQQDADSATRHSTPIDPAQLPSGDELAAELERYLRDQGRGG